MKYVQINVHSGRWTESIVFKRHLEFIASGDESWVSWAHDDHEQDDHMQKNPPYQKCGWTVLTSGLTAILGSSWRTS